MSENEGAALEFFVCRTKNDYKEDRMASSEGSWAIKTTTKNGPNLVIKSMWGWPDVRFLCKAPHSSLRSRKFD